MSDNMHPDDIVRYRDLGSWYLKWSTVFFVMALIEGFITYMETFRFHKDVAIPMCSIAKLTYLIAQRLARESERCYRKAERGRK